MRLAFVPPFDIYSINRAVVRKKGQMKEKDKRSAVDPAFLRPDNAAWYLGISRRHLGELTRLGVIPAARMGRKCTLYGRAELERIINENMSSKIRKGNRGAK